MNYLHCFFCNEPDNAGEYIGSLIQSSMRTWLDKRNDAAFTGMVKPLKRYETIMRCSCPRSNRLSWTRALRPTACRTFLTNREHRKAGPACSLARLFLTVSLGNQFAASTALRKALSISSPSLPRDSTMNDFTAGTAASRNMAFSAGVGE